ncbi:PEP-CTERM sorting domain-containing protein [Beggiatoa alba]|nr:PEP-CTERM sorting domain-containing protein [Beggiatoa alba]
MNECRDSFTSDGQARKTTIALIKQLTLAGSLLVASGSVHALVMTYDVSFETSGQSIWDSGSSYTLDETKFLGVEWSNTSVSIGGIAGSQNAIITPAIPSVQLTPYIPSVQITPAIPSVQITPAIPGIPAVTVCVPFTSLCTTTPAVAGVPAVYSPAIPAVYSPAIPATYTPAIPAITGDTRTGAELTGNVSGRVGLEVGVQIDSGSVDAVVSYAATLDIPDTTNATAGVYFNFNEDSVLAGTNTLNTNFSEIKLSADAILQLSGDVSATGCIVLAGCATGSDTFNINEVAPILSFNQDDAGGILLLGQSPSTFGLPATADGFPFVLDVAGLATVTLHLPQPDAAGGLNAATQTLQATGQDDLLDIIIDVDNVIATAAGVPGLFGSSFGVPGIGEVGFDIINVEMGPTIDLQQDFELDPTLWVRFVFDEAVLIAGNWVTEITSAWNSLPDMAFIDGITTVSPTFFLADTFLTNDTLLDFDLAFGIDLLQIYYDFGILGSNTFGIGNILDEAVDLFDTPAFYSNRFELGGFSMFAGESFMVDLRAGTGGGPGGGGTPGGGVVTVPEPSTFFLLFAGLFGMLLMRRIA